MKMNTLKWFLPYDATRRLGEGVGHDITAYRKQYISIAEVTFNNNVKD
jgi:hypothetical protein